jgi:hypothetical protein
MTKINIKSEYGGFLIGALVFVIILGIVIFSVATLVTNQNRAQIQEAKERKAFYAAEAGAEYAIAVLRDSSDWRSGVNDEPIAEGKFSVSLSDKGDTLLITSTGKIDKIQKSVEVLCLKFSIPDWDYGTYGGHDVRFKEGGTINGDVYAENKFENDKATINGDVITGQSLPLPTIDWAFYENEAGAVGQRIEGNIDFSNVVLTGVWYVTGKVTFKSNVSVKGTIVSEDDIISEEKDMTIEAVPENYPALISGHNINIKEKLTDVKGILYAVNDIKLAEVQSGEGVLIAGHDLVADEDLNYNYNPVYVSGISGIDFGEMSSKGDSVVVLRWQNKK